MLVQRIVSWRLAKHRLPHYTHLRDMKNAFACTAEGPRDDAVRELVPPGVRGPFLERVRKSVVRMQG